MAIMGMTAVLRYINMIKLLERVTVLSGCVLVISLVFKTTSSMWQINPYDLLVITLIR